MLTVMNNDTPHVSKMRSEIAEIQY